MDTDYITILEDDLVLAQTLCNSISDSEIRNRAVANIVGAKIASRFFNEKYQADCETGLHNIPNILEQFDISDIYVNNSYIDVRVYFTEDELSIPKSHFDFGILPTVYMFIKLSSDLSNGIVTGFMKPDNINTDYLKEGYYYIQEDDLSSYYDIEGLLNTTLDTFELPNELIYRYIEGSLDDKAQLDVLKELIKSKSSRINFLKIVKAQSVLNSVLISEISDNITAAEESTISENSAETIIQNNEEKSEEEELLEALDYTTEVTPSNATLLEETPATTVTEENKTPDSSDEIENLFTGEQEGVPVNKKKGSNGVVIFVLLLLLATGGYFAYKNYTSPSDSLAQDNLPEATEELQNENITFASQQEAMPVETVEAVSTEKNAKEEATSVAIPAIEKHLDASVLVSNLRVEWEIPTGYTNNSSAKRYLFKLGKIIQLNLRSELLLLSKPPLSNRITVELKFNPNISKFELVGIKDSSGEKTVDNAITDTIKNVLDMPISTNTDTFGKLQGNPILVIRL